MAYPLVDGIDVTYAIIQSVYDNRQSGLVETTARVIHRLGEPFFRARQPRTL
jgi:hypothetical protein